MNIFTFLILSASICSPSLFCNATATTENAKMIRKPIVTSTLKNDDSVTQATQVWKNSLRLLQNPLKIDDLKKIANTKVDLSNRKNRFLGPLAFLAGLSVGGIPGVPPNVNTYAKAPPANLNFGASQLPFPYQYMPHPYVLATSLGLYPLLNPSVMQAINGGQNDFQTLPQNQQVSNLLENKKPNDLLNNNDEYPEESTKVENLGTPNDVEEKADESAELPVEDIRNAEEKESSTVIVCDLRKESKKKDDNSVKLASRDLEKDNSPVFRAGPNTKPENVTVAPMQMENTTINNATSLPFNGYYGGYPQNVHHIDFTTETNEYHDYEHINYNLPTYDKPVNFYSDGRYHYYSNPSVDSSPTNDFHQEQIPEYVSNDFNRYVYPSYNTPPFANGGFRPVTQ
ncbi:uncharacterized protein LOC128895554 isoform X2 [Hylaeus anthracinus]|uniref:uncharacterized protein LOC128895554 isoform X2 n=1 Tax=Hylaeus anthracinus TaxID=313031 RepID=UPI0023B96921|nr:uncharacterized protein LOC128895554 isoform X2 [Hylaeus anthracinus]